MGTKTNPGPFNCYAAALPDEEIFTVLGRDPATPATIRFWIGERARLGKNETDDDQRRLAQAAAVADKAEAWRADMLEHGSVDGVPPWRLPRPDDLDDGPRICLDPTLELTSGFFGDGDEAVRCSRQWMQALAESLREAAAGNANAIQTCEDVAVFLDLAAKSPSPTIKVEDRVTEPLATAQIAAERLQIAITYLDLHRLANQLIEAICDPVSLGQGRLKTVIDDRTSTDAIVKITSFLRRNPPREIRDSRTGGHEMIEARDDMASHYRAWRSAMVTMASFPLGEDTDADYSYWCHEIRKLDHCFLTLGYIRAEDIPDMPISRVEVEATLGAPIGPSDKPKIDACPGKAPDRFGNVENFRDAYAPPSPPAPVVDSAPDDLAHAPEVPHHRFSVFHAGETYAYARGLEVNPQHLPTALDAMAKSGWHLIAIFGQTDAQHIGFIFEKGIPPGQEFSAFEIAHGYGGGFRLDEGHMLEVIERNAPKLKRWLAGDPLDEIEADDKSGACGTGRGQEP